MDEVKECPFCGKKDKLVTYRLRQLGEDHPGFISCDTCVDGVSLATWNIRNAEDALRAELAAMTAMKNWAEEVCRAVEAQLSNSDSGRFWPVVIGALENWREVSK